MVRKSLTALLLSALSSFALAQSPGTLNIQGPSTTPGAPQITSVSQLNAPINAALSAKADYTALANYLPLAGGTMTGALVLPGAPTLATQAATKGYVDAAAPFGGPYLPLAGGTMLAAIVLPGNPTTALQAAPKQYVDQAALPVTTGGLLAFFLQPVASDNHTNIKNGAGQVYHIKATNTSATINYLRAYDAGTGFNGCGSATGLVDQWAIPANTSGAGYVEDIASGVAFTTGISICVTTGYAKTDTTAATPSVISLSIYYK